ncbi:hypothetical protein M426DRAFT_323113 [Hypoxylon sp. CI-4A]|nr:hypothetical protein M426DRAFT_323113 [Hypoxylon sp. CI-4A]
MLADILHSLANDTSDSDGVAQLIVTALGSSGQHYICWRTLSGEYRQRSNGLPKVLQDWLFPADGSTRDFETLQVILSGEDTFFASDRNGELRSEPSGTQQRLRRALTFHGESTGVAGKRRTTRARGLSGEGSDLERPRSSTLPSSKSPTVDHLPGPHLKPPASTTHGRSASADKLRRIALVPLAFQQQRRSWATRPRSLVISHDDLGVLKEQPSPGKPEAIKTPAKPPSPSPAPARVAVSEDHHCTCGCHNDARKPSYKDSSSSSTPAQPPRISRYADASVQTDPLPEPVPDRDDFPRRQRRRRESSSSTDSYNPSTYASSKRSSFETITTQPDHHEYWAEEEEEEEKKKRKEAYPAWHQTQHWEHVPNPVMMGRMQDYFRSSTYTLGASML